MRAPLTATLLALLLPFAACAAQTPAPAPAPAATPAAPAQDPLLRERAAAAENVGRYGEAADHYLALMKADPLRAEYAIAAGRCLGRSGRFNDAIDLLTEKRNAFPGVTDVTAMLARTWLLKAESDVGNGDQTICYEDAAKLAEEVLAIDQDHEDARLILAQARYGLRDFAAAAAAADEAVRRHPQRPGAHVLAGRLAFDAFKLQKRAFEQRTADTNAPLDDAERAKLVAAIDEQRQRAKREFARAAELDPARTFARIALGEIAVWDHETDAALQEWAQALLVDPAARVDHAWIEQQVPAAKRRTFYGDLRQRYEQAHQRDAEQGDGAVKKAAATLLWYEARACYDLGAWKDARAAFERVRADNASYVNADYWAALAAWKLDDHDAAETFAARYASASATGFADVLRALPPAARGEVAEIVRFLGDRAFQRGRIDNSRDLNHVTAALVDSADAWNNYAFLCRETGRFGDALRGYEHALEKEPDSPQLLNDLGVIYQYHMANDANLQKARKLYEKAIDLADRVVADATKSELEHKRAAAARNDAMLNLQKLP